MSDGVLAAIIAAVATVFGSFLQLRTSFTKQLAAAHSPSRRKSRIWLTFMFAMLIGAGVGGFALAQWLHESERAAQDALQRDLRERIAELTLTHGELDAAHAATRLEIEASILRKLGADGVAVLATVAPCSAARPSAPLTPTAVAQNAVLPSTPPPQAAPAPLPCLESDAAPITLCATIPAAAKATHVDLFVRGIEDAASPWTTVPAGQEIEQARFADKPIETPDGDAKQVCEGFVQWSQRPRIARMVVHFAL